MSHSPCCLSYISSMFMHIGPRLNFIGQTVFARLPLLPLFLLFDIMSVRNAWDEIIIFARQINDPTHMTCGDGVFRMLLSLSTTFIRVIFFCDFVFSSCYLHLALLGFEVRARHRSGWSSVENIRMFTNSDFDRRRDMTRIEPSYRVEFSLLYRVRNRHNFTRFSIDNRTRHSAELRSCHSFLPIV